MSRGLYYNKLKNLCDSGRLSLILIIAPPRTNSTLVEHVVGNSPDILHECHEPFFGAGKQVFDSEEGYKQIYDSIGGEEFEQSGKLTNVAVKEIAHWISINDEYKDLVELTSNPVLILIRNPLLSVESRIRKTLLNLEGKADKELLDDKARKDGYANWHDLLEKKLYVERDYAYFGETLEENSNRWASEEAEFRELAEQVEYLESKGKPHHVLDTTDLRADPVTIVKELCARMKISYSPEMVDWGTKPVDFHTTQTEESAKVWYDALQDSTKINPPTDVPPTLSMFPSFVQEYLKTYNLPIYTKLSRNKTTPKELRHDLNEREFDISVSSKNIDVLKRLGVISDTTLEGRTAVKLKYIDPVYALTNEPDLVDDPEFRRLKEVYAAEMSLVSDCLNEAAKEHRRHNDEGKFR